MRDPQEVEDGEHEQYVARVAAIDVAKATGKVCTRVPHETKPGKRLTQVWDVAATTNAIIELADHLAPSSAHGVSMHRPARLSVMAAGSGRRRGCRGGAVAGVRVGGCRRAPRRGPGRSAAG